MLKERFNHSAYSGRVSARPRGQSLITTHGMNYTERQMKQLALEAGPDFRQISPKIRSTKVRSK